jgi:hypothetical protein
VVKKWLENRAFIIRRLFEEMLSGALTREVNETAETAEVLLKRIAAELTAFS